MISGSNPSEKCEFLSWDDSSQLIGQNKHVPNHKPALVLISTNKTPFIGIYPVNPNDILTHNPYSYGPSQVVTKSH